MRISWLLTMILCALFQESVAEDARPVMINHPAFQQEKTPSTEKNSPEKERAVAAVKRAVSTNPFLMDNFYRALPVCLSNVSFDNQYGKNSILGFEEGKCHVFFSTPSGQYDCYFPQEVAQLLSQKIKGLETGVEEGTPETTPIVSEEATENTEDIDWKRYCQKR